MLKRIIGLSFICMAGHAYSANILVNTTDDEDVANDKCSLREAITLINSADSKGALPTAGYQGCKGDTPVVVLESGKTYTLNKQIQIKKRVQISSLPAGGGNLSYPGENNATIKMVGTDRLFLVDDENPDIAKIDVSFNQIDFMGCGATTQSACAINGGIFFNREALKISVARISNGIASGSGGALYNDGIQNASSTDNSAGQLDLDSVIFSKNIAGNGAAIYSAQPRYEIRNSVFRDNEATLNGAAVVFVQQPANIASGSSINSSRTGNIRNSTFFSNKAIAVNLLDGMLINNSTIIKNKAGVLLNALSGYANLSNSIVSDNDEQDCIQASGNQAGTNNVVYRTGDCGVSNDNSTNPNINLSNVAHNKLLAGTTIDGACDLPPADGLLCPYHVDKEKFIGGFKPRLLVAYQKITDSPIVNRGRVFSDGTTTNTWQCESTDARGKNRETEVLCDVGAIELVIESQNKIGQDIKFDQIASIDLTDNLGDGQLWPSSNCNDVYADQPGFVAKTDWKEGCMAFVPGKEATKGALAIDPNALLKYTAFSNYHGTDNFSINLVTTTSRFSQALNDRTITLRGTIVMDPPDTFQNKKVNLGGATGVFSLLGMLGLVWVRRRVHGV